jgi:phosphomethylpyrimidine synthase
MDKARDELDWGTMIQCAVNPEKARKIHEENKPFQTDKPCTMCGEFCAIQVLKDTIEAEQKKNNLSF